MNKLPSRRNILAGGLASAVLAAMPRLSEAEGNKVFEVGNSWIDTGRDYKKDQPIDIRSEGGIVIGGAYNEFTATPDGWKGNTNKAFPIGDANIFSLIGCIGNVKNRDEYFKVGSRLQRKAPNEGRLYLSVNDGRLCDNTGAYIAQFDGENKGLIVPGHGGFWKAVGNVEAGKTYAFKANGLVDIGGAFGETSTPAGNMPNGKSWEKPDPKKQQTNYPLMRAVRYSLIGCIGDFNRDEPTDRDYFPIGAGCEFKTTKGGRLYLGVNDHFSLDNTGSYKVAVGKK